MENISIYSHKIDLDLLIEILKDNFSKSKINIQDIEGNKIIEVISKSGFFAKSKTFRVTFRQRTEPSYNLDHIDSPLAQNLLGMLGYLETIPCESIDLISKFRYKVMSTNSEISFIIEQEITPKMESLFLQVLTVFEGFAFVKPSKYFNLSNHQYFTNKHLQLLLDTTGKSSISDIEVNIDSKYMDGPETEGNNEQKIRKEKSEKILSDNNIAINKNLPFIPDAENTNLRTIQEIVDRVYALLIIAVKGEGTEQVHLERTVKEKNILSFSSKEKRIFEAISLSEEDKLYAIWRYESFAVLLWAIGKIPDLPYPENICDVPLAVGSIFTPTREEFSKNIQIKTKPEILDQLDIIYRMHWACVNARIKENPVGGNIDSSIIYERHYALNWLTKYMDQDWDNIQTNT